MSIQNNTHDAHASQEELNMKKYLALLLAAIMALSLAACASTAKTEDAASTSGKLTMATEATFQPYEYYDGDAIVGIDVEVAQAIADKLGMELEVTDIAFDSIIPGVQTGKYDMGMAGMTVTDERKEQVNFSDSYATGVQVVIVKDDSPITSVDDLFADGASTVVGTQAGTTGFIYATSDIEDAGLGTVKSFGKTTDAVEAVRSTASSSTTSLQRRWSRPTRVCTSSTPNMPLRTTPSPSPRKTPTCWKRSTRHCPN